jgi:hypothetical protein
VRGLLVGLMISLAGCGTQETQRNSEPLKPAATHNPGVDSPQTAEPPNILSRDSTASIAPEDSALDEAPNTTVVLPNGDTIADLGGHLTSAGGPEPLAIGHYTKNGTHYLRIHRFVGHKPGGKPIKILLARLRLPAMHSTEAWTDICRVNGKSEPAIIIAIAGMVGSDPFPARYAWRFDRATETLSESPAAGVRCSHAGLFDG